MRGLSRIFAKTSNAETGTEVQRLRPGCREGSEHPDSSLSRRDFIAPKKSESLGPTSERK